MDNHLITRRTFHSLAGATLLSSSVLAEGAKTGEDDKLIGPLVGHVDANSAYLWARLPRVGTYRVVLRDESRGESSSPPTATAEATPDSDLTARFKFTRLKPGIQYRYELSDESGQKLADGRFRTAPDPTQPARVSLAFGSCAKEDEGSRAIWRQMAAEEVDGVLLMGDTPYIDSTDLATQRRRYHEFAAVPEYQQLLAARPHWGTWDDHDFGKNDCDGTLPGKENSRHAFCEYRALRSYGEKDAGIYTSFRWGPMEVWLLDTRWFSATEKSFADAEQPTLLGRAQWEWLQRTLKDSTAPFKVLASGCIWDDKQNREKDDWGTYHYERQAVFDFIRRERIGGVTLFGGDIHVTRLLKYPAEETVGYPLVQFISSPIHGSVIPELNTPHPSLVYSAVAPHTFLKLTADSTGSVPTLTAEFVDRQGQRLFETFVLTADELRA